MQQKKKQGSVLQQFSEFEHDNDRKIVYMTTPPGKQYIQRICETDQIVWLLNERIQKKIDWEHQKILLWNEIQDEPISLSLDNPLNRFLFQSDRIKDFSQTINQTIKDQKQEVKTPELGNICQPVSPIMLTLQPSSSNDRDQKKQNQLKCKCKKSQCLKMYCQCFRAGKQCRNCGCCDCKNHSQATIQRKRAIKVIIEKQPMAFSDITSYKGCRCTKSQCLKGYCQCYLNGLSCGKYCRCQDCKNCNIHKASSKRLKHKTEI